VNYRDIFFRIFGKKHRRPIPVRERRKCTCCGKVLTVRVNGVTFKHKCNEVALKEMPF
jgi:hypothetical protein